MRGVVLAMMLGCTSGTDPHTPVACAAGWMINGGPITDCEAGCKEMPPVAGGVSDCKIGTNTLNGEPIFCAMEFLSNDGGGCCRLTSKNTPDNQWRVAYVGCE